jgi:hypothetical protein
MERSRHGAGVVTYVARSLRGGPLKNARVVAWDGACVTFLPRVRHADPPAGARHASACASRAPPFSSAACSRCLSPRGGWCGATDSPITPTRRRWRSVVSTSGNRPWPCQPLLGGRPRVPSGATPLRNGVRPADRCWCASRSSREEVPRRRCSRRPAAASRGCQDTGNAHSMPLGRAASTGYRLDGLGMTGHNLQRRAGKKPDQTASVGGQSNQELKLHLAVGGGMRGRDSVAARRSLTPNAFGF